MGQAKNRGDRAARVEQAIVRNRIAAQKRAAGLKRAADNLNWMADALRAASGGQTVTEKDGETVTGLGAGVQLVATDGSMGKLVAASLERHGQP